MHLEIHQERGSHLKSCKTVVFRKIHYNLRTIVNSLPVVFPDLDFHVKILFLCLFTVLKSSIITR